MGATNEAHTANRCVKLFAGSRPSRNCKQPGSRILMDSTYSKGRQNRSCSKPTRLNELFQRNGNASGPRKHGIGITNHAPWAMAGLYCLPQEASIRKNILLKHGKHQPVRLQPQLRDLGREDKEEAVHTNETNITWS